VIPMTYDLPAFQYRLDRIFILASASFSAKEMSFEMARRSPLFALCNSDSSVDLDKL
jgi:hypothetical protein